MYTPENPSGVWRGLNHMGFLKPHAEGQHAL